jgi:hypothetical protein
MKTSLIPAAVCVLLILAGPGTGQVPAGWIVTANFQWIVPVPFWNPLGIPGNGGLFMIHPTTGARVAITGLPPSITGAGASGPRGACSVLIAPGGGALIVGDNAPTGSEVSLHIITLAGTAAAGITTYPLGTAGGTLPVGQVAQMALLPSGDILVAVTNLTSPGPLAGTTLGIVRPSLPPGAPGSVLPVPLTVSLTGFMNALAVDPVNPTAPVAYFGMFQSPSGSQSTIFRITLPAVGPPPAPVTPAWVSTLGGAGNTVGLTNLSWDAGAGRLWVSAFNAPPNLNRVDPATGGFVQVPAGLGQLNAVAHEDVTGSAIVASALPSTSPYSVFRVNSAGASTLLAPAPAGGWGQLSGIAVNPVLVNYGVGTPGNATFNWSVQPNPGGLPAIGNAGFTLTITSAGIPAPGFFALSLGPAAMIGYGGWGGTLLVNPLLLPVLPLPHSGTIPLGLPNDPALIGVTGYIQSFHSDPGAPQGVAATDGLQVTVL